MTGTKKVGSGRSGGGNSRAHFESLLGGAGLIGDDDKPLVLAGRSRDGRHLYLDDGVTVTEAGGGGARLKSGQGLEDSRNGREAICHGKKERVETLR